VLQNTTGEAKARATRSQVSSLQSVAECCRVLQSVAECCRVLQSVCRVLQSVAECCRVFAECCRVLQHLRGNIDVALEAAYDPMGHVLTKFVELD